MERRSQELLEPGPLSDGALQVGCPHSAHLRNAASALRGAAGVRTRVCASGVCASECVCTSGVCTWRKGGGVVKGWKENRLDPAVQGADRCSPAELGLGLNEELPVDQ